MVDVNTECSQIVTHGDISDRYPPNVPVHFRFCLPVREWLCEFCGCSSEELGRADQKQERPNRKLRHHRKMHNWTQADLADELYRLCAPREIKQRDRGMMSTGMVSGWERGEHIPRPFWQKNHCKPFGTTPDHLGCLEEQ